MKTVTVLTPTYNRAGLLKKLYDSLKDQTCMDFVWFVVDDGSNDDTESVLKELQDKHEIEMKFVRQKNGGKHRALNRAIPEIRTELTFIVDSDDVLPENSIETILRYHEKYKSTLGLCGYSFLRCYSDGKVNTAYFPVNEQIDSFCNVRINGAIGGDKAEVFYTDILKQYPFPEIDGEKFMPEDVVWMQMSGPYKMVHINENIYTCDYLQGGLTRTGRSMKIHSPHGMILRSEVYLNNTSVNIKTKTKMMVLYIIYSRFAHVRNRKQLTAMTTWRNRGLWFVLYIPSYITYLKWNTEYNRNIIGGNDEITYRRCKIH